MEPNYNHQYNADEPAEKQLGTRGGVEGEVFCGNAISYFFLSHNL
jgi:hypothetical protein